MKKVFNKVIAIAATVPLALTQGFAVMANAAAATTISVERVLEIKPQELESSWAKLVEGALIVSEGKSFELDVADIIDSADFSDKNAAYVEKVQKCIVGNPSVSIQNSVAVMTAQVDATSYVQSNIIDAIKKELTKQGAASIIDDIDFSMLEKKGTFTAAVDGDSIENTAANKAAGTANTIRVKGAVFVDSEGNQVATYADAKAYAASTVQQLKVEVTKKAAAANLTVNLDNLLATYQKKVEKAFSYADKAIVTSAHEEFATADETLAWLKAQKEKKTTRFDVPGSVADLAKYGDTLNKAVAEINKAFQRVNVDISMDDVTSLLNSGSDFVADANADTNVYTVTFKVPDTDVDADYFSTVEGIEKYYAAHPDQAEADGVTDADYSQLVYDSSYKLVTAQGDADNDTLVGVPSGYFNVERIIKFKDKSTTTTTTTDVTGTTTTDVSGATTTDVSGATTTDVSGATTTDVSGVTTTDVSGATTTDVSGATTTDVSGATTTDVSGATTTYISGATTTDVSGVTTTDVSGATTTDVSGATTTDVSGATTTDVSGATTTDVSGVTTTDVSGGTTDVSGETTTTTTGTGDSETTTTTTTGTTGPISPVGTTTLEVEVNPANFYFSVDERELKPSDLFSKFDIVDEEGTHFDALEAGAVTLDKTTPKEIFDAEGKAYCVTEVNAYFTDPTTADAEPVAAPVNPTVYIGVKGD
ncbi:MAG: hypothetical protein MSA74_00945, partial [Ruminococcus sp.]|nr:hypothetical protein [Ruminococcus sp.]